MNKVLLQAIKIERDIKQKYSISCLQYNITIELLAKTIRKSILKDFKIQGLENRILVLLFADDTIVYINKSDDKKILKQAVKSFYETLMAKFNNEKSEVLSYRDKEIQRPSNKDKNIKWRY